MSTTNEINARVREFIMGNFPLARQRSLLDDDLLLGNKVIDSMGILELVNFIEAEFQITVDAEDLLPQNFQTISNVGAFVQTKLNGHSSLASEA